MNVLTHPLTNWESHFEKRWVVGAFYNVAQQGKYSKPASRRTTGALREKTQRRMNRMILSQRIMKCIAPNYIITEASTGEEALFIYSRSKFDVIVVHQFMQEADGIMIRYWCWCRLHHAAQQDWVHQYRVFWKWYQRSLRWRWLGSEETHAQQHSDSRPASRGHKPDTNEAKVDGRNRPLYLWI